MSPLSFVPLATFLAIIAVTIWCWARVAVKAGYSHAWGFVAAIPVVNVAALCMFALADWPALPKAPNHQPPAA